MTDRVMVDWKVPESEWNRFKQFVDSEHSGVKGSLGRAVEEAMREYALTDGYEQVEQLVDRLVQAAGRTLEDSREEKTNQFGSETTRATSRVDPLVKDSFKDQADDDTGSYGRVLAKALRAYREGGRAARLKDKLERVVDDAESMLETVRGDDGGSSMGKKERQTVAICSDLPTPFSRDTLEQKIREHAGGSDYYINEYTESVLDRLGTVKVVERSGESDLFLTPDQWRNRILVDVIDDLGGNSATDSCPAFTREEVGKAIVDNGVDNDDAETINELVETLLGRLGFVWDDQREVYDSQRRATATETADESPADNESSSIDDQLEVLEAGRKAAATDGGCE